jgi:ribosomal protein S18 acetylase RimI-like enzyme
MGISSPRLASENDAEALIPLFCSGAEGLALAAHVCTPENRENLVRGLKAKCAADLVWILVSGSMQAGMLILDRFNPRPDIFVVVIAERLRGQGLGPKLVRQIQAMPDVDRLRAEARNASSERMLKKCGFRLNRYRSSAGFPYLFWKKSCKTDD